MSSPLEAALTCAEKGWRVFPCRPGRKKPSFETWESVATSDKAQIATWAEQFPGCNWGVACGPSGLLVVDVDVRGNKPGKAALAALEAAHGPLPKTLKVRTPSGGWHFYFGGSGRTTTSTALGKGIDTRGHGGLVLLPGSMFEGRTYEVIQEAAPAPLPGWIAAKLDAPKVHNVDLSELEGRSRLTDEEVLALLANDEKAARLLDGDWVDDYPSQSEADLALCSKLSFYCGRDPDQVDRIFRDSLLMREKWDREDYRLNTLARACGNEAVHPRQVDPAAALALLTKIGPGKATLPPPVPVGFTARELQGMDVAPPRWLVENLIPLGLFILAGPPKVGKSFLLLQAAHCVASGRKLLGNPSKKAGVAYLALEDGPSRLKKRMTDLFGGVDAWPSDLHLFPSWPRLGEGGLEELNKFLDAHPGVKLVIIDTWGRFRSTSRGKNLDAYQQDTMEVGTLQTWAKDREIALVLVTHLRKSNQHAETDPFDRITGSNGQFGVADAAALLSRKRGQDNGQLAIVGRDLEHDGDIPLARKGAAWERADGMPRAHTDKQQLALDYLIDHMHGAGPKEIAEATGLTERYVKQDALPSLMEQKLVRKDGRGAYLSTWLDDL